MLFNKKKKTSITYGVIGLNNFGKELAISLAKAGKEVMVLDTDPEAVDLLREYTENAFIVRGYDKKSLNEAGIQNCDVAVSCIDEQIDTSILTAMHLVSFGIPRVIAKCTSEDQGEILEKLGAEIIFPDRDMAVRLARRLEPNHIINYIELSENIDISKLNIPEACVGQTVITSNIRRNYGLNIIAIENKGDIDTTIDINRAFEKDDMLIVIGERANIERFEAENKL